MAISETEHSSPLRVPRRYLPAVAAAAGVGVHTLEAILLKEGLSLVANEWQWRQALYAIEQDKFFSTVQDFTKAEQGRDFIGKKTTYNWGEITHHGSVVIGDSIAVGYVEGKTQLYAPELAVEHGVTKGQLALNLQRQTKSPSPPEVTWYSKVYGASGATIQDTMQQVNAIRNDVFNLTDSPSADTQPYQDLTVSAGGNDFLNFLVSIQNYLNDPVLLRNNLTTVRKEFLKFLTTFSISYKELLAQAIAATKQNDTTNIHSPFQLRRVFAYGIPNPNNVTFGPLEEAVTNKVGFNQNHALRQLISVMASCVNISMLAALDELKVENPNLTSGIDISFLSLWDLDLNGIHPTPEAYIQLAKERAKCSILPINDKHYTLLDLIGPANIAA